MIRLLVALVFALCAGGFALPARANTCTVPNSLANGQVVDANMLNTNFVALQSCGNNIDSTNIGPAGILASQIIATSAANGTFGGTVNYTFQHAVYADGAAGGFSAGFHAGGGTSAALLQGHANAATIGVIVDALNHTTSSSTLAFEATRNNLATPLFSVQDNGIGTFTGAVYSDGTSGGYNAGYHAGAGTVGGLFQSMANTATPAEIDAFNHTTSSTNLAFEATRNNGATILLGVLDNGTGTFAGPVAVNVNGTTSYVPPVYAPGGSAAPATEHTVRGSFVTNISANCNAAAICSLANNVVTFGGGAASFSNLLYQCIVTNYLPSGTSGWILTTQNNTTSTFLFNVINGQGGVITSGAGVAGQYICEGS